MIDAMKKIDSSGGHVTYNAPLLMPKAIKEEYGTAEMDGLLSECLRLTSKSFIDTWKSPADRYCQRTTLRLLLRGFSPCSTGRSFAQSKT